MEAATPVCPGAVGAFEGSVFAAVWRYLFAPSGDSWFRFRLRSGAGKGRCHKGGSHVDGDGVSDLLGHLGDGAGELVL